MKLPNIRISSPINKILFKSLAKYDLTGIGIPAVWISRLDYKAILLTGFFAILFQTSFGTTSGFSDRTNNSSQQNSQGEAPAILHVNASGTEWTNYNIPEADDELTARIEATEVTCFGGSDGTITISNPSGGSGAWEVSIGNGWFEVTTTTPYIFTGLRTGSYRVTIRDKAAPAIITVLDEAIDVTQPDPLRALYSSTNASLPFASDGTITVRRPTGGYDAYEVSIDETNWFRVSAVNAYTFENLQSGLYNLWLRDASVTSCRILLAANLEITQPEILTATVTKTNITCNGLSDGKIEITDPGGGNGDYEASIDGITWYSFTLSYSFGNLSAGSYFVIIRSKDNPVYAEILEDALKIENPDVLNASVTTIHNTCFGGSAGSIEVKNPQGGSGSWQYRINSGIWQSGGTFTGLSAGTYAVQIRDAIHQSCFVSLGNYEISSPAALNATVEKSDVSGSGTTDGSITVSAPSGGSGSYEVSINGTNWYTLLTSHVFNNLAAGVYQVRLRDKLSTTCVIVLADDLEISLPYIFKATVVKTNITCNGAANGSITVSNPSGGTGNYEASVNGTYWVKFTTSHTFTNLLPGTYDVLLRNEGDEYYEIISENLIIFEPDILTGEISATQLACFGASNGSVTITNPRGGSASYQFRLNAGSWQTSGIFSNLPAGTYVAQIRDARYPECSRELGSVTITQPGILAADVTKIDKSCRNNGTITISGATGGSGTYNYSINGGQTWQNSGIYADLAPGIYTVQIRDGAQTSCIRTLSANLTIQDLPDTTPPAITCPPALLLAVTQGEQHINVLESELTKPEATDNCTAPENLKIKSNFATLFPDGKIPVGTHALTWTAEDASGNKESCIAQIVVSNDEYPSITCPGTYTQDIDTGTCHATIIAVNLGVPVVSDKNTPVAGLIVTSNFSALFPDGRVTAGSHFVTWTVEDADGFKSTCRQLIIVLDDQLPVIACPPAKMDILSDPGQCYATITDLGTPVVSDNCTPAVQLTISNNAPAGNRFPVGTTTVIWTVRDAAGNEATCTQIVTVKDLQPPVITCPANIVIDALPGACIATVILTTPSVSDNCIAALEGLRSDGLAMNEPFPVGVTNITWTATDLSGNKTICVQTVTVKDTQIPQITCQPDITRSTLSNACYYPVAITPPEAADNCSASVAGVRSDGHALNEPYPAGITTIIWTATDLSGNTNSCAQRIIITDAEPPEIVCPPAYSRITDEDQTFATILPQSLGAPQVSDNCQLSQITVTSNFHDLFPDGKVPLGSHIISWKALDGSGNTTTCEQALIVVRPADPGIICPPAVQVTALPGDCSASVLSAALGTPVLTAVPDPSKVTVTNNFNLLFPDGKVPGGSNIVTWTLVHQNGFITTCEQTIHVNDTQAPQIGLSPLVISGTYTVPADQGSCSATLSRSQLATLVTLADNCRVEGLTLSFLAGNTEITGASYTFPSGTTSLVVTVTDQGGNQALTALLVTVTDTQAPAITCPSKITLATQAGLTYASITEAGLGTPVVSDNCTPAGSLTVSSNFNTLFPAGRIFPGVHNVTWTVRDQAGNSSTCLQPVEVNTITTVTSLTATPVSRQYSDVVTLTATVTPFTVSAQSAAQSVTFRIGAQDLGTVPVTNGNAILTAALLESVAGTLSPGEKIITAVFNGVGNIFTVTNPTAPLTIQPEDAVVIQNGQEATGSEGVIALMAIIQDMDDNLRGDIRKACISFVNRQTGQVIVSGLTPVLIDPSDPTMGMVRYNWNTGSPDGTAFKVGVVVGCYYSRNNSAEDANVVVSAPLIGSAAIDVKAYPNPFSDKVYFDLNFSTYGKVHLEIFDNRGTKIATLLDRQVYAGEAFQLEYTPQNLVSGMVLYRLSFNGKEFTGRIVYQDKQ